MFHCFNDDTLSLKNGYSATVSIGDWFKLMLISFFSFIPLIGFFIAIIVYAVLAFRSETAPSVANYLKAMFILSGISFILGVFIIVVIVGSLSGLSSAVLG